MSAKLLEEFPPVSTAQWEEVIRKDLKGADYEKRLVWQTDEGIAVKPYYRSEDLKGLEYLEGAPGVFPYTRGNRASGSWRIREKVNAATVAQARKLASEALAGGAEEIEFAIELGTGDELKRLLDGFSCPIHFRAAERAEALLELLLASGVALEGTLDYDPTVTGDFDRAADLVRRSQAALPRLRPITIGARRFYDGGSTITQEIGFGIAAGIECLSALTERGLSADAAARAIAFEFASGAGFFFGIAKLRAARLLWAQAVEAFKPGRPESAQAYIHVESSNWHLTVYDPYVNILRNTTEAMSAAIGGSESIAVTPFDAVYREPQEGSRRLARNTQLILKKEAWLERSADPAGGSYYVEVLTDSIARESWKLVQEVEAGGGFRKAWTGGLIPGRIEKSRVAKIAAVSSRRRTILGTNQYPNLNERMLDQVERTSDTPRAATPFEAIRLRTERYARKSGRAPGFLLLEMGDLKMRKARAGFVTNFFGCAGFRIESAFAADTDQALAEIDERKPDAVVLCSSDEQYQSLAEALLKGLAGRGSKLPVIVAGYPKDAIAALTAAGVAEFVHIRSNAVEVLTAWQSRLGVKD